MRVTVPFNIGMTFALIGLELLGFPLWSADPDTLVVELMFPGNPGLRFPTFLLSVALSTMAYMFIFKATWNRLFPHLCGWRAINLAESYAISIMVGVFLY